MNRQPSESIPDKLPAAELMDVNTGAPTQVEIIIAIKSEKYEKEVGPNGILNAGPEI